MTKTLIFSDDDADGLTSARLAELECEVLNVDYKTYFQAWDKFGIDDETEKWLKAELSKGYDTLYFLDSGSDESVLSSLKRIQDELMADLGQHIFVHVIDNHPPENAKKLFSQYLSSDFVINSSNQNCTAGLLFEFCSSAYSVNPQIQYWAEIWAIIGLQGDVAYKSGDGKVLYDELISKHPELLGNKMSSVRQGNEWNKVGRDLVSALVSYFHIQKRVAYGFGTEMAHRAMKEIEKLGDLFAIEVSSKDKHFRFKCPALALLKSWADEWHQRWTEIFKNENNLTLEYPHYVVMVINSEWDCGSAAANVRSNDYAKTSFVINLGTPRIHISARNPSNETVQKQKTETPIDVGNFFKIVTEQTSGKINGGGLSMAGSALIMDPTLTITDILSALAQAEQAYFTKLKT